MNCNYSVVRLPDGRLVVVIEPFDEKAKHIKEEPSD